jgi:hypothetical protein
MRRSVLSLGLVAGLTMAAVADWDPGNGHKMHFPQLPDPIGWDVNFNSDMMFDDWKCSSTGPVDDIHFWLSNQADIWQEPAPCPISRLIIKIRSDVPAGADPLVPYSHPGEELWGLDITDPFLMPTPQALVTIRHAGSGNQGWIDWQNPSPSTPTIIPNDHMEYYQINVMNILDPFIQELGNIYWLGIHVHTYNDQMYTFGWKTSINHWNDNAAYFSSGWQEMFDPDTGGAMDLAFVITPEPAALTCLLCGALLILRRHR